MHVRSAVLFHTHMVSYSDTGLAYRNLRKQYTYCKSCIFVVVYDKNQLLKLTSVFSLTFDYWHEVWSNFHIILSRNRPFKRIVHLKIKIMSSFMNVGNQTVDYSNWLSYYGNKYYGSQWLLSTDWLPTFFKIYIFVCSTEERNPYRCENLRVSK